jgi:hypothetical protein
VVPLIRSATTSSRETIDKSARSQLQQSMMRTKKILKSSNPSLMTMKTDDPLDPSRNPLKKKGVSFSDDDYKGGDDDVHSNCVMKESDSPRFRGSSTSISSGGGGGGGGGGGFNSFPSREDSFFSMVSHQSSRSISDDEMGITNISEFSNKGSNPLANGYDESSDIIYSGQRRSREDNRISEKVQKKSSKQSHIEFIDTCPVDNDDNNSNNNNNNNNNNDINVNKIKKKRGNRGSDHLAGQSMPSPLLPIPPSSQDTAEVVTTTSVQQPQKSSDKRGLHKGKKEFKSVVQKTIIEIESSNTSDQNENSSQDLPSSINRPTKDRLSISEAVTLLEELRARGLHDMPRGLALEVDGGYHMEL